MKKDKIKALEELLDERHAIAVHRDRLLGNTDDKDFLPSNPDFIYYKAVRETVELLGFY